MRYAPILLALLLAGCPDHRVKARTVVAEDGSFTRTLVFREKEHNDVWGFFAPAAGYKPSGEPKDGITTQAAFPAGAHSGGIRVWLENVEGDRKARAGKPSRLHVRVEDLVVGRLFLYREQFEVGVDPQRVRRELPDWIDVLGDVYLDALKRTYPDLDVAPLDKHFVVAVKPWLVQTVLRFQLLAAALMRDWQANRIGADESDWIHNPLVKTLLAELEVSGLLTAEEATPEWLEKKLTGDDGTPDIDIDSADVEDLVVRLVRRRLGPGLAHLKADQRAEVLKRIVDPDDAFKQTIAAAWERQFPGPQRLAKQKELEGLAVAALGAGVLAIAENVDIDLRLEMPGTLLKTNGLLERGAVRFRVDDTHFWFAGPMLHATSFVPAAWAGADWDAKRLLDLAKELGDVSAKDRAAVSTAARDKKPDGLDDYQRGVLEKIRRYVAGNDVSFDPRKTD
ncbi:MAG: hypothetical protein ACYTGN_12235 [Planctomycetota bacterium]|jgi:hypothetical protein